MALAVALAASGCAATPEAEIVAFRPAEGTHRPGGAATSVVRVKNPGSKERTFWIGHSVRDELGAWHDVPAGRIRLSPGATEAHEAIWSVPERPRPPSGEYAVAVSVWDGPPAREGARRLADARRDAAFRVSGLEDGFSSLDGARWETPEKDLGRGTLDPANAGVADGKLRLRLPAGTRDGGEIESSGYYARGSFRARIKAADAPSSITGFFLYAPPDYESEVDVEIYNDSTRRVMFTTYAGGGRTHTATEKLPFDPTQGFHEYRFDLGPEEVGFYVDGEKLKTFRGGLPNRPMRLLVNAWFPTWLPGEEPETDRYTQVDWIRH